MGRTAPKFPLSAGDLNPHLIHGSLGPHQSVSQMASRSVQPLLHSSPVCPTHKHTDHATCGICSNRPLCNAHMTLTIRLSWKLCESFIRSLKFFLPVYSLRPYLVVTLLKFHQDLWRQKTRPLGYRATLCALCFDRIPACDHRQTDRQINRPKAITYIIPY